MSEQLSNFLKEQGVTKVFFCAGSRNSSLHSLFEDYDIEYHFDERAASFQALGFTKMTDKPVVVCVTSGTALAECLPAVIEAFYAKNKMIIVSADRPLRLRDSFAPQTISQSEFFHNFTRSAYTGELKDFKSFPTQGECYPVHFNLEIDDAKKIIPTSSVSSIDEKKFSELMSESQKVLVVLTHGHNLNADQLLELDSLQVTKFVECTSNSRLTNNTIKYDHTLLKYFEQSGCDTIVKFGHTPISKLWRLLDNKYIDVNVIAIDNDKTGLARGYSFLKPSYSDILAKLTSVEPLVITEKKAPIDKLLKQLPLSEASVFNNIVKSINSNSIVYCGNSMPIRYMQMFSRTDHTIYASRGANGIDGQVATAIGIAKATQREVHCIVGDLTFLYDLKSAVLDMPVNLMVHVVNNNGGRIFERVNGATFLINNHDKQIRDVLPSYCTNICEHIPDNEQTRLFWNEVDKL